LYLSMSDKNIDESKTPNRPESSEYGDVLTDVLKDQARRNEARAAAPTLKPRSRLHPGLPPVLALISIWLWAFPPSALQPEPPTIPVANQEAGLRMEMFIQVNNIRRYLTENGSLPNALEDAGDGSVGLLYEPLTASVFRLSGQTGEIVVAYTSTEPIEDLMGNARAIVGGIGAPSPGGGPPS
jgi:hypothetical protein